MFKLKNPADCLICFFLFAATHFINLAQIGPAIPSSAEDRCLANLANLSAPKQRVTSSLSSPFQDNVTTTLMAWMGSSIYCLPWLMPNFKENKIISLSPFTSKSSEE